MIESNPTDEMSREQLDTMRTTFAASADEIWRRCIGTVRSPHKREQWAALSYQSPIGWPEWYADAHAEMMALAWVRYCRGATIARAAWLAGQDYHAGRSVHRDGADVTAERWAAANTVTLSLAGVPADVRVSADPQSTTVDGLEPWQIVSARDDWRGNAESMTIADVMALA